MLLAYVVYAVERFGNGFGVGRDGRVGFHVA
jgi:hypothetical protein